MKSERNAGMSVKFRFEYLVNEGGEDECWEWQGARNKQGYGVFTTYDRDFPGMGKKTWQANRLALVLAGEDPQPGQHALHSCNNPPCVNPAHLEWGTPRKNTLDAIRDGLWSPQRGEDRANAKFTEAIVRDVRRRYVEGGISQQALADECGVSLASISRVLRRERWKHVT